MFTQIFDLSETWQCVKSEDQIWSSWNLWHTFESQRTVQIKSMSTLCNNLLRVVFVICEKCQNEKMWKKASSLTCCHALYSLPWVVTLHRTRAELADIALWWIAYGHCHRQLCHHRNRHHRHHNCYHWHALLVMACIESHRHHHHYCYHHCPCQHHQRHHRQCLSDGFGMGIINASDLSCHCSCHRHRHFHFHYHCNCYFF